MTPEQAIRNASISLREFGIALNKLYKKEQEMKNIIKQIRKIKGVVMVERAGENMAVVVGEPSPQKIAVKCTDKKQFEFVWSKTNDSELNGTEYGSKCICDDGHYDAIDLERNEGMQDSAWFKNAGYKVITFGRYLDDYSLRDEWDAFNKPKSLSPDELVDGKIYVDEDGSLTTIFRHKYNGIIYSRCEPNGNWINSSRISYETIRHATHFEAQYLIRAEIANNYFHELK